MPALSQDVVPDLQQENARLSAELRAAQTRQNATAEILRTIASSPRDADAALQKIAHTSAHLFEAASVQIQLAENGEWGNGYRFGASAQQDRSAVPLENIRIGGRNLPGAVVGENRQIHIADLDRPDPTVADFVGIPHARAAGTRTICGTPLRQNGHAIGVLVVYRDRLLPFSDEELALQRTFADQAVIAIENARLFNESKEALERQTANAEVLQVINSSPGDLAPVFDTILAKAHQLCGVVYGSLHVYDGERFRAVAVHNLPEQFAELLRRGFHGADHPVGRALLAGDRLVHLLDCSEIDHPVMQSAVELAGIRTALFVPLRRDEALLGMIVCGRREIKPFSEKEISLVESFATQAAVAVQNAGLLTETREALERQTATADILKVIASSPSDVQPVFEAIAIRANALLGGFSTAVFRFIDGIGHLAAFTPTSPAADDILKKSFPRPIADFETFALAQAGKVVQTPDVETLTNEIKYIARARGFRSMMFVPLVSSGAVIGMISVTRRETGNFVEHHVQLLQTFADQAVIAIENARLFNQVQQRTRDLAESLQQQTAIGEVLKTISRSTFDLQPVLDTLVRTVARLCDTEMAFIMRRQGNVYRAGAAVGYTKEYIEFLKGHPITPDRGTITGRAVLERRPIQIDDVSNDPEYTLRESTTLAGQHTALCVPLLREGEPIGTIVLARQRVEPFTEKQIELVTTFADQAVIAMENVRLFDELRQRTDDLSESLQQQTATADVLKVISRSTFDLPNVLKTLVSSAARLCGNPRAAIYLIRDGLLHLEAAHNNSAQWIALRRNQPLVLSHDTPSGRAALSGQIDHVPDLLHDPEFKRRDLARLGDYRATLNVPLVREGITTGVLSLARPEPGPFTERQIEIVQTFADQAVIAIENVRLFEQLEAKRRDLAEALTYQTGSANILKVIASSPTDVGPVMKAIVESACELCDAADAVVLLRDGDELVFGAQHGTVPMAWRRQPIDRRLPSGRAIVDCKPVHVHDLLGPEGDEFPIGRELAQRSHVHTILTVPMLREDKSIGAIALRRTEINPFNEKQIALLQTFADQAVIAIGNVRLFEEVQERTRELMEALEQQTATSEVLQVISSSPGELEPVFRKMLENATRVCGANFGVMNLCEGDSFRIAASYNVPPAFAALRQNFVFQPHPASGHAALISSRQPVHIRDLRNSPAYLAGARHVVEMADVAGARTIAVVPMLRDNELMGTITIYRTEVRPFTDKQIGLIESFTKQAVIAIENTRLLKELRQRTDDLSEALEQQTATAEVLATISSSAGELEPVFDKMLENATRICGARFGTMNLYEEGGFRTVALFNAPQAYVDTRLYKVIRPHPASGLGTVEKTHETVHIDDIRTQPPYIDGNPNVRALAELGGARTLVIVPMLKEDELIGTITIFRQEVKPFTGKQIELVSNFANQAVIAIENARLLNELRSRTRELSQSLEELRTAQDRLVQTEKLASLGQLTAGIAHEIKNPLNFVNNFSSLSYELIGELNEALRSAAVDEKLRTEIDELMQMLQSNLEKIVQHGKRADSIVKNMLLHSRQGASELRRADINAIVEESLNLAYHGARAEKPGFNIALERDLDPAAEMINLYPQEITRVLLNLISNGFYAAAKRKEAAGDGFEPKLSVATNVLGSVVEIRIRDNGTGIPPGVKEKIFNPFFTTKPPGEGTGLGLSICHDIIVKQHSGSIDVVTEPGTFTEFIITLPRDAAPSS
ncbi:GAF domain-containing protein [Bradyrhizobium sp. WYCCWR 13023]|uniref:histidine kinase n=1 Tax=Bradyrhizobium zhengyangense TaxID=2911009 RepID=A0A9X1RDZ9_9BRAD|nr:GAF domain-containing protein [Bradyrhizobium zhengyangense]MCG2632557.1 GAF domain-containing protein [Bradyrhizobium zhengyangense]